MECFGQSRMRVEQIRVGTQDARNYATASRNIGGASVLSGVGGLRCEIFSNTCKACGAMRSGIELANVCHISGSPVINLDWLLGGQFFSVRGFRDCVVSLQKFRARSPC